MPFAFDRFDALRRFGAAWTVAAFVLTANAASAQFNLSQVTLDGGGGTRSTGGTFGLGGTLGQPDAGLLTGASFTLSAGFWFGGGATAVGIGAVGDGALEPLVPPRPFHVNPAAPNPIAERTTIAFYLPAPTPVRAALYDATGRLVRLLADEPLPAGEHERAWDRRDRAGRTVSSGIYFLRFDAGTFQSFQKLVVIR